MSHELYLEFAYWCKQLIENDLRPFCENIFLLSCGYTDLSPTHLAFSQRFLSGFQDYADLEMTLSQFSISFWLKNGGKTHTVFWGHPIAHSTGFFLVRIRFLTVIGTPEGSWSHHRGFRVGLTAQPLGSTRENSSLLSRRGRGDIFSSAI